MTPRQKTLRNLAPHLDPLHMESLAIMVGSDLTGMPAAFFEEIASHAVKMGPERLAALHGDWVGLQ